MSVRVYEYGLLPPTQSADIVRDQLRAAHRYYNRLIELEHQRRAKYTAMMSEVDEVSRWQILIMRLEARLEAARERVKRQSIAHRRRGSKSSATRLTIAALRRARVELRAAKRVAREGMEGPLAALHEEANGERRAARKSCGVYWGTYLLIEEAIDQAAKAPAPPRYRRWTGEGRLGVQLQGGEPIESVLGDDPRLRIEPVPELAHTSPVRGERRRLSRTKLWLRVGTVEGGRDPIWAIFPMVMHRPIPAGSIIKRAVVKRFMVANREHWKVHITVIEPDAQAPVRDDRYVALDLGWRSHNGGLRVGYLLDEHGQGREVSVASDIRSSLEKADSIRSIRDRMFDDAKALLLAWSARGLFPEELRVRSRYAHAWRSQAKLSGLLAAWKERRVSGDEDVYEWLQYWNRRDVHLWRYEAGTRRHALLRRREHYRILAAELAKRYDKLVLEDFDLTDFAHCPAPEEADVPRSRLARVQRTIAAPAELRQVLLNAFGRARVIVPAAYTTKTCATCGHVNEWTDQAALKLTCAGCGDAWDQDRNACLNLLRAARCHGESPSALATKKPGRGERLREAKAKRSDAGVGADGTARE